MPGYDFIIESPVSRSGRARQLEAMFEVPPAEKSRVMLKGNLQYEERDWNIGLIVGPSGCGKTTVATKLFGASPIFEWKAKSVIDDFNENLSIQDIAETCMSVGFNTIPAWLRPFHVLSNGEKFRVDLARRIVELPDPIVIDEFTSVVDRQVAQIGSHAVAKIIRKNGRKLIAVSCHYDIVDWLQPDWIFEPASAKFQWRSVQRRPKLQGSIQRVHHSAWKLFSPYHYMSADLHIAAACYGFFVDDRIVGFAGVLQFPHAQRKDIRRISRFVVLPDWQGLGIMPIMRDHLGAAYKALGYELRGYPAHPILVRAIKNAPTWKMIHGQEIATINRGTLTHGSKHGGRFCAVFKYVGPSMDDRIAARRLIEAK